MKKKITGIFALLLAAVIGINLSGCAKRVQAADLSQGITPVKVEGKAADAKYSAAQMNFALKLLEKTFEEKGKENPEDKAIRIRLDKKRTKQPEER